MGEATPFKATYSYKQGRIEPASFITTDGAYAYVLGSELNLTHKFSADDEVAIAQTLDLTDIQVLRMAARVVQPTIPVSQDLTGVVSLKQGAVLEWQDLRLSTSTTSVYDAEIHAGVQTRIPEPYSFPAGRKLRVAVDGGGDQDLTIGAGSYTAALLAGTLTSALAGAQAKVGLDTSAPNVIITSNSVGASSSIEVKDYTPNPLVDANDHLLFSQKDPAGPFYGADDLSAVLLSSGTFSSANLGQPLVVSGATNPANNQTSRIIALPNSTMGILSKTVVTESAGFTARLRGAHWEFHVLIDSVSAFSVTPESNRTIRSNDIGINVSKLSGSHEVKLQWKLVADA